MTWSFSRGTGNYGVYSFEASSSKGDSATLEDITIDNENPEVDSQSPEGYINDDSPTVSIEASDSVSSMDEVELSVDGDDVDESANGSDSAEIDLSGLSDGQYDVSATLTDSVGNTEEVSWDFTVDTSYDGDTDPTVSPSPQVFRVDSDDPMRINVELEGANEESGVRVTCEYQGGVLASTSFHDIPNDGSETYDCDLNPASYMNMAVDLSLNLEDRAGNTWTQDVGEYIFDFTEPELDNLSAVVGVFNSDFQVSYDASDTGDDLSVGKIHYQIDDSDLDLEAGSNVSEVDGDFEVDTSGLEAGEHTVYAWAVDRAGRVSDVSSFGFDFRPNAEPNVALGSVDSLSVTAGDSKVVSVNATNTGELFIGSMSLELLSDISNQSRSLKDLEPGEMDKSMFSVDTSSDDLGVHDLTFSTESPDASRTVRFVVEANSQQEDRIKSDYEEYISKYDALKQNVSNLKSDLSGDRKEALENNTSEFFSDMESAKRARESGDLYLVENHLENISTDFQTASSTYEEVRKKHQTAERNQTIGLFLLLFVGLGGSGLAYIAFFSEEYYLDLESLKDEFEVLEEPVERVQQTASQYELSLEPLEDAVEKVSEILAEEEEELEQAEEQAFQGFT